MRLRPLRNTVLSLAERVASIPATPTQLAGLFAATVIVRNLLESMAAGNLFPVPAFVFHFPIAYVFPMAFLTVLLHLLSGYSLRKLLKLMVFAWTLTLLPPFLDYLLGTTSAIGYFPLQKGNALHFLLNFFNPSVELQGTTAGIRIEAAIGCLLAGVFAWSVAPDRRFLRGIGTSVIFAPVFLFFFTRHSLVHLLTVDIFPYAETLQEYYQWHAATAPHFTGSLHYTAFIVDLVPVTLILAWFYRRLYPDSFSAALRSLRSRAWVLAVPPAGTLCFAAASGGSITFADAVSAAGAFMSSTLLVASSAAENRVAWTMRAMALAAAAAVGWPTSAFLVLGVSMAMLPGPAWVPGSLSAASAFLVACSPAGLSWGAWFPVPVLLCGLAGAAGKWPVGSAAAAAAAVAVLLAGPSGTTSYREHFTGLFDAVSRNGRLDMSLQLAREMAASGGDILNLGKAELEAGNEDRALWCYGIASKMDGTSTDAYRLGLNLALAREDEDAFDRLMDDVMSDEELRREMDIGSIMLARASSRGDTLFIRRAIEMAGPSPQLFHAFSTACAASGDPERASAYAAAALSHPDARAGQYAWAIILTASTGGDFDSLFRAGMDRFPRSTAIMRARLMVPLSLSEPPDREDLLDRVLKLQPASPAVLRTAALWSLGAGRFRDATDYSVRAIAATGEPDAALLLAACTAADAAGDSTVLDAMASYARSMFPGDPAFLRYLEVPAPGDGP
ncbi:MAG: hypothetical protein AVO35_03425 [Candidatus Aegiribacteria sp. MLS_C]|nr:MAG: hypothetical protein AVO35_03425 [Candidatus Aegiribacteria sp. MLS_C]